MARDPVRKWITRRPLMLLAACLVSGMAIGYQNAVPWWAWLTVLLSVVVLGVFRRRAVFFFASALPLGALLVTLALIRPALAGQDDILLTGRIASEPTKREEYTRITLDSVCADGEALPTRVMLYLYGEVPVPLEYGAQIRVTADTYLPSDYENPYADSYSAYLWQKGIALCASAPAEELSIDAPPEFSVAGLSIRCRMRLQAAVDANYSKEIAPLVSALVLGDRSTLPDELYESFKAAGLAHLLAISGLHISCLAAMLDLLLRRLRCPGRLTVVLVTLFLIVYGCIVGFPASIARAVLMYMLSSGARLLGRPSDGLTGLSLALMILLVINPLSIGDISLILSFSSVAGLMCFTRLLSPRRIPRFITGPLYTCVRWVLDTLAASLSAQLTALPTVACVFSSLPVYSLLGNLIAIPLMTLSLPAALISGMAGVLSPAAGRILAFLVEKPLELLISFTGWVAALPGASLDTPAWPAALILLYILLCLLCSPVSGVRRRLKQLMLCLTPVLSLLALLLPATFPTDGLEVLFLDAGQADAAVIRAEDTYYLMDVGENSVMADYLAASGIRPAGVFLSHPHTDHAGGLEEIIALCPPSVLYIPCLWGEVDADEGVPELLSAAEAAGWLIQPLQAGDGLRLSDHVTAHVHQPFPDMTDDANEASLCISVSIGEGSVLFTGDLTTRAEQAFFPDCDVLKVAHHGAKSSTGSLLLQMTTPSAAVISVGHNSYGHPAPETIARLEAAGASVYRTDEHGAVSALLGPDGLIQITPMNTATESEAVS